jgi:hypothetical protein
MVGVPVAIAVVVVALILWSVRRHLPGVAAHPMTFAALRRRSGSVVPERVSSNASDAGDLAAVVAGGSTTTDSRPVAEPGSSNV